MVVQISGSLANWTNELFKITESIIFFLPLEFKGKINSSKLMDEFYFTNNNICTSVRGV